MIKIIFTCLLLCTIHQNSYSQKNPDVNAASISNSNTGSVDALASYIKENFTTDTARIRAIYTWITHNINYDIAGFLARENNPGGPPQTVADVLHSRKAVCQGYSHLFSSLCKEVGINAYTISGYTKLQGKVSQIPHAWVAASLGGDWYLFDPTWGAGYVKDEKYIRRFNNAFYSVTPANFIADHMPFDPMNQFLSYPLTHKEFIDGTIASNKTLFNYRDTLKQYNELSIVQQHAAELRRLEAAGIQNDLLRKRQVYLKTNLQSFASSNSYTEGAKVFKSVVAVYNVYVAHKNKKFSTIGDNDLRQMVDSMEHNIKLSRSLVSETIAKTDEQRQAKTNTLANMDRFWSQFDKEKQFVKQYFVADQESRKQLFMKR